MLMKNIITLYKKLVIILENTNFQQIVLFFFSFEIVRWKSLSISVYGYHAKVIITVTYELLYQFKTN